MCGLQVRIADDPVGIIAKKKGILAMLKLYEDSFFKVKYHDTNAVRKSRDC